MDEVGAVARARELVSAVNPKTVPIPVEDYVRHVGGVLKVIDDMGPDEPGMSFVKKGKLYVCVNQLDSPERQRFTACHEVAHYVLGLPSEHAHVAWWSYTKRPQAEILCDVFAAELLLPWQLFKPQADRIALGFAGLDALARLFDASVSCTGSRFATVIGHPCAFVLVEQGHIRYASRSTALRTMHAWITPRTQIAPETVAARLRAGTHDGTLEEVDPDLWFEDWNSGGALFEEARHLTRWDQTLVLLWGEEDEIETAKPRFVQETRRDEEYRELDGNLPWPGNKRRK
ncbi:MAG: ImmA/IrrE family metallo-endopeptidase [Panacagrimonas sp.]